MKKKSKKAQSGPVFETSISGPLSSKELQRIMDQFEAMGGKPGEMLFVGEDDDDCPLCREMGVRGSTGERVH